MGPSTLLSPDDDAKAHMMIDEVHSTLEPHLRRSTYHCRSSIVTLKLILNKVSLFVSNMTPVSTVVERKA